MDVDGEDEREEMWIEEMERMDVDRGEGENGCG